MSGVDDYRKNDNTQICEPTYDADSDDYVEIDGPEVNGELQQNKIKTPKIGNDYWDVKESKCACKDHGILKFRYYLTLFFGATSTVILVFIGILLIAMYAKIAALEFSSNLHDVFSLNQSQLLLNKELQNLYEGNQEFFNRFQQTTANISNAFSRLLFDFQEVLTDDLEDKINNYMFNPTSCADTLHRNSSSSSDYYLVRSSTGQLTSVYCDMTRTCGSITGGWMRVAELDLDHCPTGLKSQAFNGIKTCIRSEAASGCTSVLFSSFNIPYSKVCGQIRGYAVGTVDGMYGNRHQRGSTTDNYLDGVSITSNTTHIWSFVAAGCVCSYTPSPFISSDWTCDGTGCSAGVFCNQLLWNTSLCGESTPFLKRFSASTTADIEMKVCRDEARDNEDIAISSIELYVQ